MKKRLLNGLVMCLFFILSLSAFALTLSVDDSGIADYSSIQTAINAASSGDIVYVYPGTYYEKIILKDNVRLLGSGANVTTIDGSGLYKQVVTYNGIAGTEITGFTITGSASVSYWTTSGIYCQNGPITISNCVITGNYCGISVYNGKPNIVNNTITGNLTGICVGPPVFVSNTPSPCYPSLPSPKLVVTGVEDISGSSKVRLLLRVTNWYRFPDDLFAAAPSLPPCGINTSSSRTWVHIYNQDDVRLYGFCALGSAAPLYDSMWVAVDPDNMPAEIYIVLKDRECGLEFTSNSVSPAARPSEYTILNNIISNNSNIGLFFYSYTGAGQILYNNVWGNTNGNYFNNLDGSSFTPWPGTGQLSLDPRYADAVFHLEETSPCIDTGHPGPLYMDLDGTRNDMGAYGGLNAMTGPGSHSGQGFVFTSIGKVPVSEITQDLLDPANGLANVDPALAAEYGIDDYYNSPFGGKLWIHGLFGESWPDSAVKYYQILVGKWNGSTPPDSDDFVTLNDPLTKILTTVNSDGSVDHEKVSLGPGSMSGYDNLYKLTRSGFYNHIDLRMIWNTTSWENGKYTVKYAAYEEVPFIMGLTTVRPIELFDNDQDDIVLVVDNSPVEVEIREVQYDSGIAVKECSIIHLSSDTENLRFYIKAWHPNGYLGGYSLTAHYGKNKYAGIVGSDHYAGVHDATPYWSGEMIKEINSFDAMKANTLKPWITCAYRFHLYAWSRATDGFDYIRDASFNDHYYIEVDQCRECLPEKLEIIKR